MWVDKFGYFQDLTSFPLLPSKGCVSVYRNSYTKQWKTLTTLSQIPRWQLSCTDRGTLQQASLKLEPWADPSVTKHLKSKFFYTLTRTWCCSPFLLQLLHGYLSLPYYGFEFSCWFNDTGYLLMSHLLFTYLCFGELSFKSRAYFSIYIFIIYIYSLKYTIIKKIVWQFLKKKSKHSIFIFSCKGKCYFILFCCCYSSFL